MTAYRGGCAVTGCPKPVKHRQWCGMHYQRFMRTGDVGEGGSPRHFNPTDKFLSSFNAGTPDVCWEWNAALDSSGYGVIHVNGHSRGAHRFAYLHFIGPIGDGVVVRHRCDNPRCVNPHHLELGSVADNVRDMDERGRRSKKLSKASVAAIRRELGGGNPRSQRAIALQYGVSQAQISNINLRKKWKEVT